MKYLFLSLVLVFNTVSAESTIIVIPSDYDDYSYTDTMHFESTGQMKDESYSNFVHREEYLEEDMQLEGYLVNEE